MTVMVRNWITCCSSFLRFKLTPKSNKAYLIAIFSSILVIYKLLSAAGWRSSYFAGQGTEWSYVRTGEEKQMLANVKPIENRSPMTCPGLLTHGQLLDGYNWQPQGCDLHNYTKAKAQECLRVQNKMGRKNRIVFFGDSRMRYLYQKFTAFVGSDELSKTNDQRSHNTANSSDPPFLTENMWCTYVDKRKWRATFQELLISPEPPSLIVVSAGLWHICYRDPDYFEGTLEDFKAALRNWTLDTEKFLSASNRTMVLLAAIDPVEFPHVKHMCSTLMTNSEVDLYNAAIVEVLEEASHRILFWTSGRELVVQTMMRGENPFKDQVHLTDPMKEIKVQMLLNLYCNEVMHIT